MREYLECTYYFTVSPPTSTMDCRNGLRKRERANVKKKYHFAFIAAYILIILAGVVWHAGGVSAETTIKLTVNSHTTSTATMNNMKPGDEMHSEYTILNEGHEGFNYFVDFKFISGDVELYNILQMTLKKEDVIIYTGAMSEAAGRVSIGSLAGSQQSSLLMDVTFPLEAGNEYQGKVTTVAFEFSASGEPSPTAEPTPMPAATDSSAPTTPQQSISSASPTSLTSPTPTATPIVGEVSITEAPVPLGGVDDSNSNVPSATPSNGSSSTATDEPNNELSLPDEELPLAAPEAGDKLPNTAEPWYNLILGSLTIAVISIIILRRLKSKR